MALLTNEYFEASSHHGGTLHDAETEPVSALEPTMAQDTITKIPVEVTTF